MSAGRADSPLLRLTRPLYRAGPALLVQALLLLGLGWFLIYPILSAVATGLKFDDRWSLYWLKLSLTDRRTLAELVTGIELATLTTLASAIIAIPLAAIRARCSFRGQNLLSMGLLVPMILPPFVGALAMKNLLGQFGAVNQLLAQLGLIEIGPGQLPPDWLAGGFVGVVILQTLHLFPILYLNATAALANVDPSLQAAARNLGAGPLRSFFTVTLPLMRPGLFAGGTIVFIWSFTDVGTPLILNYTRLLPVTIFEKLTAGFYSGETFSLVLIMLTASVLLYVVGKFIFGRGASATQGKATTQSEVRKLGWAGTLGAWVAFGLVIFAAILPHIGVVLTAFSREWWGTVLPSQYTFEYMGRILEDPDTYNSIINSLRYAGLSTLVDIVFGCVAAWLIVRSRPPGKGLLDATCMLPLAVPGLILAAGYVAMTVPGSLLESIGPRKNPLVLLVIAYSVRRLPLVVRGVSAGLQQVPESMEEAARNLGSSPGGAAGRITLPLILANLIAAGVLTFTFAMLEVSDSLVLAQLDEDYPITKQIYELSNTGTSEGDRLAAALGVYGMVLLASAMLAASLLLRKRLGAIFRA